MSEGQPTTMSTGAAEPRAARARVRPDVHSGLALLLIGLHAVLAWWGRSPGITTRQDDANYLLLARSIRQGGYNELFRVDMPYHNMYPPLYPGMLSVWGLPFGDAYNWILLLSLLSSTAALGLTYLTVRRVIGAQIAVIALLPLAVNPGLLQYAGEIATEAPYAMFTMLCLYLLSREERTARTIGLATAAAIAAALTRSVGVTLLAGIWLFVLTERRWMAAAYIALASIFTVGVWLAWTIVSPEQYIGRSYVADALAFTRSELSFIEVILTRLQRRVPFYLSRGLPWVMGMPTIGGTIVDNLVLAGTASIGLLAGTIALFRRWRPAMLYVLVFGTLIALWTWETERFFVPVLPILVPTILVGLRSLVNRVRPAWAMPVTLGFAILVAAGSAARAATLIQTRSACPRTGGVPADPCLQSDQASYFAALEYISENTDPDARFVNLKPEPLYFYTGRQSVHARRAMAQPPETFVEHLRDAGTDYVLLGSLQQGELGALFDLLELHCQAFAVEQFFPARTWLFRLRVPGEPPGQDGCEALVRFRELNRNRIFGVDP